MLGVLASLLNYELSTGQSIDERWGGAFETVSFARRTGRIEKLDNVLHTFWSWRDDGKIDFQTRFYVARYFDELFVLQSAEYEVGEDYSIKRLKSNRLRLVPSLLRPVRDGDLANIGHVDFSYDHVCCHVGFRGELGSAMPRAAMILAAPRGGPYDVDLSVAEDGSLRLRLPGDTVTNVFEAAKRQAEVVRAAINQS